MGDRARRALAMPSLLSRDSPIAYDEQRESDFSLWRRARELSVWMVSQMGIIICQIAQTGRGENSRVDPFSLRCALMREGWRQ